LWTESFFPNTWFSDAAIDNEERCLKLPSITASRNERVLWLGHRIITFNRWLSYDPSSSSFAVTQHVKDLPPRDIGQPGDSVLSLNVVDSVTSGLDNNEKDTAIPIPDSPPVRREPPTDIPGFDLDLGLSTGETLNKKDSDKTGSPSPKPDVQDWVDVQTFKPERMPQKPGCMTSEPHVLDLASGDDSTKA